MSDRLIECALTDRDHLDHVLLGIEQNNAQRFVREKAHF
jgi:hypothetical protein